MDEEKRGNRLAESDPVMVTIEELLLTIMSSLAQEESRSISENVRWGQRKKFSDG